MRRRVATLQRELNRLTVVFRVLVASMAVGGAALVAALVWTVLAWGNPSRFEKLDTAALLVVLLAGVAGGWARGRRYVLVPTTIQETAPKRLPWRGDVEDDLADAQEQLRSFSSRAHPELGQRRRLYREDAAEFIDQYQRESRRYRRVHNVLQSLIMIGSAVTTTIGALDSGGQPTWQGLTIVGISFAITLAAMFTGYYKYRERAYFLQQTADAIEEEVNAATLGVGPYATFGPDREGEALAEFTKRVEDLRNEQRRRQQQLDQPADQASPATASATS